MRHAPCPYFQGGEAFSLLKGVTDRAVAILAKEPSWTSTVESSLAPILSYEDAAPMVLSQMLLHPLTPCHMAIRLFQWACISSPSLSRLPSIATALATSLTCPPRLSQLWPALRSLEMQPLSLPSHFVAALIKGLGDQGLPFHAKHLFSCMYCYPDVHICGALLHAMLCSPRARKWSPVSSSSSELLCQVWDLFHQMVEFEIQPNVVMCTPVINGLLKANKIIESVELCMNMEKKGCIPDAVTYGRLMDNLLKAKEISRALKIFSQMERIGCRPNAPTVNSIFDGLLQADEVDKALAVLTKFAKRGTGPKTTKGIPNAVTYSILVDWIVKQERLDDALVLLEKIRNLDCESDGNAYDCVLNGLLELENVKKSIVIMTKMEERGLFPQSESLEHFYQFACDRIKNEESINDQVGYP